MFNSQVLEIATGIIFVFLVASLLATAIRELIENALKTRAVQLERGIRQLLDDPSGTGATKAVFDHPLVFALFNGVYDPAELTRFWRFWRTTATENTRGTVTTRAKRQPLMTSLPSYIPSRNFALAILDLLAADGSGQRPESTVLMASLRANATALKPGKLRDALLTALTEADGDFGRARASVEAWFDSTMDRVSGWYKRESQVILLVLGAVIAVLFNINTLAITHTLATNNTVRGHLLVEVEAVQKQMGTNQLATPGGAAANGSVGAVGPPDLSSPELLDSKELKSATAGLGDVIGWCRIPQGNTVAQANTGLALKPTTKAGGSPKGSPAVKADAPPKLDPAAEKGCRTFDTLDDYLSVRFVRSVLGWLITACAVSLGAPFWFDLLNKMMVIRSTVKPAEKSGTEGSDDRKGPRSAAELLDAVVPPPAATAPTPTPAPAPAADADSLTGHVRLAIDMAGRKDVTLEVDGTSVPLPLDGMVELPLAMGLPHALKASGTGAAGTAVMWSETVRLSLEQDLLPIEAVLA